MRRMITRTASALLTFLLLFGLAACGSKPQDGAGSGDVLSHELYIDADHTSRWKYRQRSAGRRQTAG